MTPSRRRPLRIAVIAGEESGDLLGADLVHALKLASGRPIELIGVGGDHLAQHGMRSLFDPEIIAIAGVSAVVRDLPRLIRLTRETAYQIADAAPDCVVTIDSPAFNLRVARKIRKIAPGIPIVHYVCPSVWAWLPRRAAAMKRSVDRVLCLLPFEPEELVRLGGPQGSFVGHRLMSSRALAEIRGARARAERAEPPARRTLMLLPGSRGSEVRSLLPDFIATVTILRERGHELDLLVPTLPRHEKRIRAALEKASLQAEVTVSEEGKHAAFARADVALAASGTVLLELAIAGVPMLSCYRFDSLMKLALPLIRSWSGALPNLITDSPIIPEFYQMLLRPARLARVVETLWREGPERQVQIRGFSRLRAVLSTDMPAGEQAARIVLETVARNDARRDQG